MVESLSSANAGANGNYMAATQGLASGFKQDFETINYYIQKGDTDSAVATLNAIREDAGTYLSQYGEYSDNEIRSILSDAYSFANDTENDFTTDILNKSKSPFATGLLEGIPIIGHFQNANSDSEIISELTDSELNTQARTAELAGAALSGAASYGAIGALVLGPLGAGIGAVFGGALGIIKCAVKN